MSHPSLPLSLPSSIYEFTGAGYYKFHTMLTGTHCFNNSSSASEIIFISDQ